MKNYKYYIIGIVAFLALLAGSYFVGRHYANKSNKAVLSNYIALQDTVRNYQTKIDGLSVEVFETKRVILSQKDAIKVGLVEKEALKKLNIKTLADLTTLKMQISIVRDSVKHNGQVVYIDSSKHNPAILLPFTFSDKNKYFALAGGYDLTGKMNYNFDVPALNINVYGGVDKKGIAKLSVTTDNPYIKFNDIQSIKIDVAKQRRIGFGIMAGYGVVYVDKQFKLAPAVTAGVFYRIW